MTNVTNLRLARKARDRGKAEARAAENRVLHGQTKAQKKMTAAERERLARTVDGAKLDE